MKLELEVNDARTEIVSDGYDMSFGEVMNLYRDDELIINPEFQRLFRWDITKKTRFVESLLLGIPIPPIFVFQNETGIWELVDGLQRLSTVLEFAGMLRKPDGGFYTSSVLEGTEYLPSLSDKRWEQTDTKSKNGIGRILQIEIKRARIRVEILKRESDPKAKYELFQRLNTGGESLSEQEVRNCVAVMINKPFHTWLTDLASNPHFINSTSQTQIALEKQTGTELALRFLAFRNVPYESGKDVHAYLTSALLRLASDKKFRMSEEGRIFSKTFELINSALGENAFKKWNGHKYSGKFLLSVFEVVATGVSFNLSHIEKMKPPERKAFLNGRIAKLWQNTTFQKNSGAGVRGTTRLTHLLPLAKGFFTP